MCSLQTIDDAVFPFQAFESAVHWICQVQQREKLVGLAAKTQIFYKGKTLRENELTVTIPKSANDPDAMALIEDEATLNVDIDRRKREFDAAMRRAEKGLKMEPLGTDRLFRRYWHFEGLPDKVWVSSLQPTPAAAARDAADQKPIDYGVEGQPSQVFESLRDSPDEAWSCFSLQDGTLKALHDYLTQGPRGPRETHLLKQFEKHEIKLVPDAAESAAEGVGGGGAARAVVGGAPGDGEKKDQVFGGQDDGYDWKQLPRIGDVAWARRGDDPKTALWYPVIIVEPPSADVDTDNDEEVSLQDDDEEWLTTGSEYIGKRVELKIFDNRKHKEVVEQGRIFGYLPVESADYVSEKTGESAALWRVKFEDKAFSSQDLEEFEVKEAIKAHLKTEAAKKCKDAEFLSSKSLFGQTVKWVYCRTLDDRPLVECFPIGAVLPFLEFREEKVQAAPRSSKARLLALVERANEYLEEHTSSQEKEEDLKGMLRELGLPTKLELQMTDALRAACQHCARHPRVMTVIQRHLDTLPLTCTVDELRGQLLAMASKLEVGLPSFSQFPVINALHYLSCSTHIHVLL